MKFKFLNACLPCMSLRCCSQNSKAVKVNRKLYKRHRPQSESCSAATASLKWERTILRLGESSCTEFTFGPHNFFFFLHSASSLAFREILLSSREILRWSDLSIEVSHKSVQKDHLRKGVPWLSFCHGWVSFYLYQKRILNSFYHLLSMCA